MLVDTSAQLLQPSAIESCSLSPMSQNRVISTEDLQPNFQHFITNFNQPLFTKYLLQQQQLPAKLPTPPKPKNPIVQSFASSFFAPQNTSPLPSNSSNLSVVTPLQNPSTSAATRDFIPFKCPLCSLCYRTQTFLNEHMRKEHSVLI